MRSHLRGAFPSLRSCHDDPHPRTPPSRHACRCNVAGGGWNGILYGSYVVTEWGERIKIADGKRPPFVRDSDEIPYSLEGRPSATVWRANDPTKRWDLIEGIWLRADHPYYERPGIAQPSPADTVTVVRMTEAQLHEAALAIAYDFRAGWRQAHRDLGLIRPATKAETIAAKTKLPLADVERVIAALGEG